MAAAAPTHSYILWFSQRVGSTLLAQALEDTGVAGRPGEWLSVPPAELLSKYGATGATGLRDALWRAATSDNGVIGLKYGMRSGDFDDTTAILAGLLGGRADPTGRLAWESVFPRCKHVFLTRRNKVRLAVSWWRAIKTSEWHRRRGEPPRAGSIDDLYDRAAIEHLFTEASLREAAMQEVFERWSVVPHTVVYEDLIAAFETTVRGVLDHLAIDGRERIAIPAPAFDRLADPATEEWVQRFRRELQAGWSAAAW